MDNPGGRQTKIEHMNEYQSVKSEKKETTTVIQYKHLCPANLAIALTNRIMYTSLFVYPCVISTTFYSECIKAYPTGA